MKTVTKTLAICLVLMGTALPGLLLAQTITFTFANGQVIGGTYAFDVMVAADATLDGAKVGDTQVYLNYNTAAFGASVAAGATVTEGSLLQDVLGLDGHELVNVIDNTTSRLAITTNYKFDGADAFSTALTTVPQQLLHVVFPLADGSQSTGLSFQGPGKTPDLMSGQQYDAVGNAVSNVDASDTNDSSLPVELVSFVAVTEGDAVLLKWTTASETNNAGFAVEWRTRGHDAAVTRTGDGEEWMEVAFVEGRGTTTQTQRYSYRVEALAVGAHGFRLKQIDFDGAFSFSEEVEGAVEMAEVYQLSAAYPNPFNPQTAFTLAVKAPQRVEVMVFNLLGQRVAMLHAGPLAANQAHRFVFRADHLSSGVYVIRAEGERFAATQQVLLVK